MPFLSALMRVLALAASVFAVSQTASADPMSSLGSCPGTDQVEGDLKNASASGYFIPGLKLIILNRAMLEGAASPVKKFIFAHECAHADPAVGSDEDAADCAAAKRGQTEGWLGKTEIIQVCVHLSHMPVDATHKSAAARCANIRRCSEKAAAVEAEQLARDDQTHPPGAYASLLPR